MLDFLIVAAAILLLVYGFSLTFTGKSKNSRFSRNGNAVHPPVTEGICYGLVCSSMDELNDRCVYVMVLLLDRGKLLDVVRELLQITSLREFKKIADNPELKTLGYFTIKSVPGKKVEIKDQYRVTVKNKEYTCKRIKDDILEPVLLPDGIFQRDSKI